MCLALFVEEGISIISVPHQMNIKLFYSSTKHKNIQEMKMQDLEEYVKNYDTGFDLASIRYISERIIHCMFPVGTMQC